MFLLRIVFIDLSIFLILIGEIASGDVIMSLLLNFIQKEQEQLIVKVWDSSVSLWIFHPTTMTTCIPQR